MNSGISLGVMQPDPKPVLFEMLCPRCFHSVRALGSGFAGEHGLVLATCGCGETFEAQVMARELDS